MEVIKKLSFRRFFGKIFNKMFLLYSLSYLLSMIVLSYTVSAYLEKTLISREEDLINVATDEAAGYIRDSIELADEIVFNTYIQCYNQHDILEFMTRGEGTDNLYRKAFFTYMIGNLNKMSGLRAISYYRKADGIIFSCSGNRQSSYDDDGSLPVDALSDSDKKSILTPLQDGGQDRGFRYTKIFNSVATWDTLGCISLEFGSDGLDAVLGKYARNLDLDFILVSDGVVLYEMTDGRDGEDLPLPDIALSASETGNSFVLDAIGGMEYYLMGKQSGVMDVGIYCLIPRSEIERYIRPARITVFIATMIVGLLFVLILCFGNRYFSRRMNRLLEQIRQARKSDLSYAMCFEDGTDELGIISSQFNGMLRELQEYVNKTYRYELKQKDAEYKMLLMQINPHFLSNALETIRMKSAIEGNGEASRMIYSLSLLLRQATRPVSVSTLSEEVVFCTTYLELFTLKFEQGLIYEFHIQPDCGECGIIRHILQPLLENSIIHGFVREDAENRLAVYARREGDDLMIRIRDNGVGMDGEACAALNGSLAGPADENRSDGIGLHNANDRIRLIYGEGYGIEVKSRPSWGTEVLLRLKYLTCEEVLKLVQPDYRG